VVRVLVIEDEVLCRDMLATALTREGYDVDVAKDGVEGLVRFATNRPDIVLLDMLLPDISGTDVCRRIQSEAPTPVIMVSGLGSEDDVVLALELGAADYVTKPFSPRVLLARVRAVLRREQGGEDSSTPIEVGNIIIHPRRFEVLVGGRPVDLTASEFRILHFLARKPGWVFTRQQIVDAAQGEDGYLAERFVTDRSVDVHMVSLRRKLGAAGGAIETVRGVGYRLKEA